MAFLFAKKTHTTDQMISGLRIASSAQGMPIPLTFGMTRVEPNLGWYSNFLATPHTTESGGKGGGGGSTSTSYTYSAAVAFMMCEGPITGYGQVWKDKNVTTTTDAGLTEFLGGYTQSAWSFLTSSYPSQALSYRGQAYLASSVLDLGDNGTLPNFSVETKGLLYAGVSSPDPNVGVVMNALLTNANYGAGFPAAQLYNIGNFALYCASNDLLVSPSYSELTATAEIVTKLCKIGNSAPVWSEGLLKFMPFADSNSAAAVTVTSGTTTLGGSSRADSNGTLVAAVYGGAATANVATSTDGVTWTVAANMPSASQWSAIAANSSVFVATTNNSSTGRYVARSTDGLTWTQNTTALASIYEAGGLMIWTGAYFFSCSGVLTNAATSPDGITWTSRTIPSHASAWRAVGSDGAGLLVMLGSGTQAAYSTNHGFTWTSTTCPTGSYSETIAHNGSMFVAVDTTGGTSLNIITSADGITWTQRASVMPYARLQTVVWNGNVFLAWAGRSFSSGNYAYSIDGLSWTGGTLPTNATYTGCLFGTAFSIVGGAVTQLVEVSYQANVTPQYYLTDDDFLDVITITRKRQADAYNAVQIECLDRANSYNTYVVEAKDQANIELYGLRPLPMIQAHEICLPSIARNVAQLILQRELYIRNQYEFPVGWAYARLEPMDVVAITDAGLGLSAQSVRIISIAENDTGQLDVVAEDLIVGVSATSTYTAQTGNGFQPNRGASAGNCVTPVVFQPPAVLTVAAQVWLGTSGAAGADFGGAQIWASNDASTYQMVGEATQPARFGVVTANWPAGVNPDITNNLAISLANSSGTLTTASNAQADADSTLSYVDGELISYSTATLTGNNAYTLSAYIRRGLYDSYINTHLTNSKFMRLDDAVVKIDLPPAWVGVPIYIKLLSYNSTGGGLQSLADVAATTFTPSLIGITPADGIISTITARYMLTIPLGFQYVVNTRMTVLGRVVSYGRLSVVL